MIDFFTVDIDIITVVIILQAILFVFLIWAFHNSNKRNKTSHQELKDILVSYKKDFIELNDKVAALKINKVINDQRKKPPTKK